MRNRDEKKVKQVFKSTLSIILMLKGKLFINSQLKRLLSLTQIERVQVMPIRILNSTLSIIRI